MAFQFEELTLYNWLVYSGINKITFAPIDSGKNLVVLHGSNGFGKTSFLKALQYVFHDGYSREQAYNAWTDSEKKIGSGNFYVRLKFKHQERTCQIERGCEITTTGSTYRVTPKISMIVDGRQQDNAQDFIEEIIPTECQQFVFFDGAEITRYAERQHDEGVKTSIEQVLGIPAVRNLLEDLDKLRDELGSEQNRIISQTSDHERLVAERDEVQDEIKVYLDKKQERQATLKTIKNLISTLDKETADLQRHESELKRLDNLNGRLADREERLDDINSNIQKVVEMTPLFLLQELLEQIVLKADAKRKVITPQSQIEVVSSILDDSDCICGRPLTNNEIDTLEQMLASLQARAKLQSADAVNTVSPEETISIRQILAQITAVQASSEGLMEKRSAEMNRIEETETEIDRLRQELAEHENRNISELMKRRATYEERKETLIKEDGISGSLLSEAEKRLKKLSLEIDELGLQDEAGRSVTQTLAETRKLREATAKYVSELVELKRQEIQDLATSTFLSITNKPDEYTSVSVKEDYTLQVLRKDGSSVDNEKLSAGEKEVLAFSFITALNMSSPNPAPFVMDTPFGHLDQKHRNGVLNAIPNLDVQVFLLATDKDLSEAERAQMQSHIQQEFLIERLQDKAISQIVEA